MLRRQFNLSICALALSPHVALAHDNGSKGPLFWLATRGQARVFIFGFAGAKDNEWFTPSIQQAFKESSELWLEVGHGDPTTNQEPAAKQAIEDQLRQMEHESDRTFFDVLSPEVRKRTLKYMTRLDIKKEAVENLRPWKAYYVLNSAYWKHAKPVAEEVYIDEVLAREAEAQHKIIHYEMPGYMEFAKFMSAMPDVAQSQYIQFLLDFVDERDKGENSAPYEWINGHPGESQRSLDRMRTRLPDLYREMQIKRNTWWAMKTDRLLDTRGTYFIGIGMLHVLGPDGIPQQLLRRKIVPPNSLHERPDLTHSA